MRFTILFVLLVLVLSVSMTYAQGYQRLLVDVPKVDPASITIDGQMNEAAWATAAHADMVTNTGFNIFMYPYFRPSMVQSGPDYNEMYARMLWAKDTLYVFMHISKIINDSTDLFWGGQWTGNQLFIGLSDRLGVNMKGWYDGNVYAAPDGPYHFLILADSVTLNASKATNIPDEYQRCVGDTQRVFHSNSIAHWATTISPGNGLWDVELAVYCPGVNADGRIGFNIGGSDGSYTCDTTHHDAYSYYCWQPSVADSPFAQPPNVVVPGYGTDPGFYTLANSDYWPILHFTPGAGDYQRDSVGVPMVQTGTITVDGKMDEPAWSQAAHADMVTNTGFNIFMYPYFRPSMVQSGPDYNEMYARMLWAKDTLYVFMHISKIINDSTDLFWGGQWTGNQLFIGLSGRLGVNMKGWYDGNVYAAPEGPYHFLILADSVTLNASKATNIPGEYKGCPADTQRVFHSSNIAHWATTIDKVNGLWDVELAVYSPAVNLDGRIGFNIGGSDGSYTCDTTHHDAYSYYCWKPSVVDSPFAQPPNVVVPGYGTDPGYYTLANSDYWPLLTFTSTVVSGVNEPPAARLLPGSFSLDQNYPNPFNPSTTIMYSLPRQAKITLTVFNVLGQKIATLVDGQQIAGRHSATWNAGTVASGVYFLQMKADDKPIATRKMMLLK